MLGQRRARWSSITCYHKSDVMHALWPHLTYIWGKCAKAVLGGVLPDALSIVCISRQYIDVNGNETSIIYGSFKSSEKPKGSICLLVKYKQILSFGFARHSSLGSLYNINILLQNDYIVPYIASMRYLL